MRVFLSWTDNSSNEDGFRIERSIDSGSFSLIGSVGVGVTTYQDDNVETGSYYTYRVYAYNSATSSLPTNVVVVYSA